MVGVLIPWLIVYFIPDQKTIITLQSVAVAFTISVAIGILFGVYPAMRRTMDPTGAPAMNSLRKLKPFPSIDSHAGPRNSKLGNTHRTVPIYSW